MKEWLMTGAVHLAVGFAVGWLVFKRPELISRWFAKIKEKVLG